ncbi:CobW family GTP-binding protein [Microbulbifer halophilus]|uniref:CobW family GTP-binding protein n=1 Tax=Microbulbifer halophilus TaxID=453963 RepID=A0ABW5EG85_9GAMM|nr:GTP-binding protein [Microbulbifer halophilus]MCW8128026.1 GTP-binding protein [Microbulbifer halophilus]
MTQKEPIREVPANVITGFLGVGKTTAIRHLLDSKPAGERWAVLVNEFGEVGVDGGLFGPEKDGEVFIREVPGGCMCCTTGLPMQVALNQLLARARPQRLLIEPTGLGHPREVLSTLSDAVRAGVLDLRATLTLVDARCIEDERYLRSDSFRQQLEVADLVVANKSDLYGPQELESLRRYLSFLQDDTEITLQAVEQGRIQPDWLYAPSGFRITAGHKHGHRAAPLPDEQEPLSECGYLRLENSGEGYHSCGWRFDPTLVFDYEQLFSLISGVDAERVKGVFITEQGVFGFNKADSVLSVLELDDALDSRVEAIDPKRRDWDKMESGWLSTLSTG